MAGMNFSMGQLESGNIESVARRIKERLRVTYDKLEAVMTSSDPTVLKSLLDDPLLPDTYKMSLRARANSGAQSSMTPEDNPQTKEALADIRASFEITAAALTTQVGLALKKAFSEAVRRVYFWGLFAVASGFVFTLFLPELALRKTYGQVNPPPGEAVARTPQDSAPQRSMTAESPTAIAKE
jgi:hypothetical protein